MWTVATFQPPPLHLSGLAGPIEVRQTTSTRCWSSSHRRPLLLPATEYPNGPCGRYIAPGFLGRALEESRHRGQGLLSHVPPVPCLQASRGRLLTSPMSPANCGLLPCCLPLVDWTAAQRLWLEQQLKSRQMVLQQQAASAAAASAKTQREVRRGWHSWVLRVGCYEAGDVFWDTVHGMTTMRPVPYEAQACDVLVAWLMMGGDQPPAPRSYGRGDQPTAHSPQVLLSSNAASPLSSGRGPRPAIASCGNHSVNHSSLPIAVQTRRVDR